MKKLLTIIMCLLALNVYALENKFDFSGKVDVFGMYSGDDYITANARVVNDHKITSQLELNGTYRPSENFELNTTLTLGNYLTLISIDPYNKQNNYKGRVYYLNGKYKNKNFGEVTLGRYGLAVNPYVFQRCSNDDYFENELTQSGLYPVLGGNWTNEINNFSYNLWYGKPQYNVVDEENFYLWNYNLGLLKDYYGGQLGYDFKYFKLSGLYSQAQTEDTSDKANVAGLSLEVPFGDVSLNGNYYTQKNDDRNKIYDISLTGEFGKFGAELTYINIDEDYNAPGDWEFNGDGCIQGVRGYKGIVSYNFNDSLSLSLEQNLGCGSVEDLDGKLNYTKGEVSWDIDKMTNLSGWLKYREYKLNTDNNIYDTLIQIKLKRKFGNNFNLAVGYEYNHDSNDIDGKYSGNMIFSQFSVTF